MPELPAAAVAVASLLNAHGVPPCPECGRNDFRAKTAWGLHRKQQHGIAGLSKAAVAKRGDYTGEFSCEHCSFVSQTERGLNVHKGTMHGSKNGKANKLAKEEKEKHGSSGTSVVHSRRDTSTDAEEAAFQFGRAVGRAEEKIGELCSTLANETGHAPRELAGRLTEYLFRATRRS